MTLGCAHCGSALDATRPEVELIARHKRAVAKFPLALGKRGYLFDQYWDVIGALKRKDALDIWNEYLLFNPYVGYRWLVEYKGDWQFGTMVLDVPEADADGIVWRGERFTSAGPDQQVTATCVIGEFYWRIKAGDQVRCVSFERGDVSLSCEVTDEEVNWTQLVPIAAREVQTAFAIDGRKMPGRRFAQQAHAATGGGGRPPGDVRGGGNRSVSGAGSHAFACRAGFTHGGLGQCALRQDARRRAYRDTGNKARLAACQP
ncbi:DUF4178 domain-containing protein [Novosphingobium colocasiae]